jgi:PhnB protein
MQRRLALAVGAAAVGALAIGALAIGTLAIGSLAIKRATIKRFRIEELIVDKLTVTESTTRTPSPGMSRTTPEGWHNLTHRIVVRDPAALVRFLKDAFGARGEHRADAPSQMRIGDSLVMVSGVGPRAETASFLYLYVDDADATYRRALEAGATSLEAPQDTPYGDRRAMVTDPFGNDWQIATYRSPAPNF